jgi:hypothetical protein
MYRFYKDLANAHISELEHEAQDARLARPAGLRGAHIKSKPSNLTRLAPRLVKLLHRLIGSLGLGVRGRTDTSLVAPQREFAPVVDHSCPAREILGGAKRIAGTPGSWSTNDDLTLQREEDQDHHTGNRNIDLQMRVREDETSSTELRSAMHSRCTIAS